jgi:uncharacterized iron-regulated membrane protein
MDRSSVEFLVLMLAICFALSGLWIWFERVHIANKGSRPGSEAPA